jgi:hypothetical protein
MRHHSCIHFNWSLLHYKYFYPSMRHHSFIHFYGSLLHYGHFCPSMHHHSFIHFYQKPHRTHSTRLLGLPTIWSSAILSVQQLNNNSSVTGPTYCLSPVIISTIGSFSSAVGKILRKLQDPDCTPITWAITLVRSLAVHRFCIALSLRTCWQLTILSSNWYPVSTQGRDQVFYATPSLWYHAVW